MSLVALPETGNLFSRTNSYIAAPMAAATDSAQRRPLADEPDEPPSTARTVPIMTPTIQMSAPSPGDPMEITTPTSSAAPSTTKSPGADSNGNSEPSSSSTKTETPSAGTMPAPAAAAAAVHQPKIVQTAFIHKLYNMLEDPNIQHLISWSSSSESFVMSPTHDFSKVLAQYFKHTNISSFVRQLNMYGFHKVSDVFANGSDSTLWEFKHGGGNFKRGDLVGLREIKRRASRHTPLHRDYSSSQKPASSQPGTPAEPIPMPEGSDPRLMAIERTMYEMSSRLQRSEENAHYMHIKQQTVMDTVTRLLHFNQELSRTVLQLVPNPENQIHRDVVALQGEIQRQAEMVRSLDEPHDFSSSRHYLAGIDNAPVSPRQLAQDDASRSTLAVPQSRAPNYYRPSVPSNLSLTTRRPYGSIGAGSTSNSSPSSLRTQIPAPPPVPHPLAHVEPPPGSLARRHTSADIRAHGWQPNPSPYGSGPSSSQWPSSPNRVAPEDQRLRESLSTYSLQSASQPHSRPETPPPPFSNGISGFDSLSNWSWNSANRDHRLGLKDSSAPPTRRGSMAHILNPTDTAEREDEDEDLRGEDDRKRKRIQ
ncbi:uncharacterized protein E0L32_008803 [Thyridium curvatum]|uniref:HSF-type DNA-binding domain-containing protein n=1 Tax=Thyridium curvatum TaxID=1093900 RepID=A0A507ATC6_9PEZI|nr:uncharacterized protein E0L32_008803 [Thyridium curvatum]TPX09956.1 hypothetical protein E0L32_008803 [Thyridium curvatum]